VADHYIIIAKTNDKGGRSGLSALLVDKDTEGFTYGRKERKMGYGGSPTQELILDNCLVPRSNLLGNEGEGFSLVLWGLNGGRVSVGALALGIARSAYEFALSYAKSRIQFGRAVSSFQGIQWKLADMNIGIEAARWMLYRAASLADSGKRFIREASIAKCLATDTAMQVTTEAVQILGGYGYTKEFPVERYMREAKIFQIVEGTNEIQRNQIAREILNG
jgi:alkylation response protein AidB-like acyl-CoA dehydrogenase